MKLAQTRERCVDLAGWKFEQSISHDLQSKANGKEWMGSARANAYKKLKNNI
jgi:hypothetical protein